MELHPQILRKAFEPPEIKITSDFIQDLFAPVFSPIGSNKRATEEAVVMNWVYYLQSLERCDNLYLVPLIMLQNIIGG